MHRYAISFLVLGLSSAMYGGSISPAFSDNGSGGGAAFGHAAGITTSCQYSSSYTSVDTCSVSSSGTIPVSYPAGLGGSGNNGTIFSGSATSWGDSNGLHAIATVSDSGEPVDAAAFGCYGAFCGSGGGGFEAEASQSDTLTPVAPSGYAGGPFYVQYSYALDGEFSYSVAGSISLPETIYVEVDADFSIAGVYSNDYILPPGQFGVNPAGGVNTTITTTPIEFTSLAAMPYTLSLTVDADVDCAAAQHSGYVGLCSGTATADFGDTLTLTGISFEDANGDPISGFGLTSSSGSDYSYLIASNQTGAPEPGTVWMMIAGLAVVVILVYDQRRSRRHLQ